MKRKGIAQSKVERFRVDLPSKAGDQRLIEGARPERLKSRDIEIAEAAKEIVVSRSLVVETQVELVHVCRFFRCSDKILSRARAIRQGNFGQKLLRYRIQPLRRNPVFEKCNTASGTRSVLSGS